MFAIEIPVDTKSIEALGIKCVVAEPDPNSEEPRYLSGPLHDVLSSITSEA